MALKSFHEYLNSKGGIPAPIKDTGKAGDHVEKGKGKGPGGDGSKAPKKGKVGDDWTKLGGKDLVTKFDSDGSTKTFKKDTIDRKSTRLNSSHSGESRMPSSA